MADTTTIGTNVELPTPFTGPTIGQPMDRVDGRLKVTGGAQYSSDMPVAGVTYAALIMSTIASGTITAMDTTAAESAPGILAVLTPFNAPKLLQNAGGQPQGGGPRPVRGGLSLLQDTNVYYSNQPIGVVVADTLEAARAAANSVVTTYGATPFLTDIDKERTNAYAPAPGFRGPSDISRGDPDTAWSTAAVKVQNVYTTPMQTHNPMEPHATLAVWDGEDKLTVYDASQGIFSSRGTLAYYFGLPQENVRCLTYFVGGGFGSKGTAWSHVVLAAMAAKQVGRPVNLALQRSDMYGPVGFRPITQQTVSLGANTDGTLTVLKHDVVSSTSTFQEFIEPSAAASRLLYACPNVATSQRLVKLNYGTPTYTRAPGEASGTFALESAMDELSYALNMDPIDLRLKNYAETDPERNLPFSSKSLRQCYQMGADRFGWSKRTPAPRSMTTPDGLLVGMGVGTATYPAFRSPSSALARINADGTAYVESGTQDIGTGTYTVMTQIAADALGITADKVRFGLGDTNMPQSPQSGGSQTAASAGSGVYETGMALRAQAIALAVADPKSPLYQLSPDSVQTGGGRLFSATDFTKGESYVDLLARHNLPSIEAQAQAKPYDDTRLYSTNSFGAVFAEVHVDPDLGTIRLSRITGVYGVGKILNAKTARSQMIGGITFGIGFALLEDTLADLNYGRVLNADLGEYHLPVNADIPVIDIAYADEVDPHINPLGIKGIGEIGITGVAGAIANAVYHATGTRVRDLPITLDKLVTA